jgi:hypothetical protein
MAVLQPALLNQRPQPCLGRIMQAQQAVFGEDAVFTVKRDYVCNRA